MSKNIILIGMRGAGKTTVANILANKLNIKTIDMDSEIAKQNKMSIKEIIEKYGIECFRNLETEYLKSFPQSEEVILSTGGGVILKEENRDLLKKIGKIFYLYTLPKTSHKRIGDDKKRPILTKVSNMLADLENLFSQRKEIYESVADYIIDTEKLNASEVTNAILEIYKFQ